MQLIEATINRLSVRPAVRAESLWMYALIDPEPGKNGFDLANDAIESSRTRWRSPRYPRLAMSQRCESPTAGLGQYCCSTARS